MASKRQRIYGIVSSFFSFLTLIPLFPFQLLPYSRCIWPFFPSPLLPLLLAIPLSSALLPPSGSGAPQRANVLLWVSSSSSSSSPPGFSFPLHSRNSLPDQVAPNSFSWHSFLQDQILFCLGSSHHVFSLSKHMVPVFFPFLIDHISSFFFFLSKYSLLINHSS